MVQLRVDSGHSDTSSSSAVARLKRGLKQASSRVTRLDIKSDEQMGQLMRVEARGKLLGLLYFFTTCLRPVPRDCWLLGPTERLSARKRIKTVRASIGPELDQVGLILRRLFLSLSAFWHLMMTCFFLFESATCANVFELKLLNWFLELGVF